VTPAPAPAPAVSDVPSVIKNEKTGSVFKRVDDPSIEELKIKRQKKEGTYVDPNLSMLENSLTQGRSGKSKRSSIKKSKRSSFSRRGSRR